VVSATASLFVHERQRKKTAIELLATNEQLHVQADELTEHRERLEEKVNKRTAEVEGGQ
jgi:hypothetical protein